MMRTLWKGSPPLTATGLGMLVVLVAALVGLVVDDRLITGTRAWLKPAKFAVSVAIYTFTLAWIFSLLPDWPRTRRIVGWITAVTMAIEIPIIVVQVIRGTTSHFNVATPLDGVLFGIMGVAIFIQTFSTVAVAVALWRTTFTDRALGVALRFGVTVTIVGASTGALMTQPTPRQLEGARAGEPMRVVGAHTVGAPDGGPGLPGTGWSVDHGDLRVPHFVGLHAMQALPLVAALLARRRLSEVSRVRLILVASASYVGLFAILLAQALRGQAVFAPDAATLTLFAVWLVGSGGAASWGLRVQPPGAPAVS